LLDFQKHFQEQITYESLGLPVITKKKSHWRGVRSVHCHQAKVTDGVLG